jgi:hypothetical protein
MTAGVSGSFHGGWNLVGYTFSVNPQWRDIGHADAPQHGFRGAQAKKKPELTLC